MRITDLNGKNICILGYGREGKAMVAALEKYAPSCEITIADINESVRSQNSKHWMQVGTGWLENLEKFDVLIKSPGIPLVPQLEPHHKKLTGTTQIFLDSIADSGATVIGVTGSKGKSTTASLIYAILKAAGKNAFLVGNIGEPSIAHLAEATKGAIFVMEMSSYQLMDTYVSPHIAVITSFFPEHLDYHGSLENYLEAKKHITKFQGEDDMVFFCSQFAGCAEIAKEGEGRKIPFSSDDSPIEIEKTKLIGAHNLSNITAACMVAATLGIDKKTTLKAVQEFKGLPHRLESIGIFHELEWIDDAISTTPESTIAALDALGDRVVTIILGGQDRGYDFSKLAERIKSSKMENIILFPGSGPRIKEALEKVKTSVAFHEADSMEKGVGLASRFKLQASGKLTPIVLLSTASPSYGMFKNFEEKGEQFQKYIKQM